MAQSNGYLFADVVQNCVDKCLADVDPAGVEFMNEWFDCFDVADFFCAAQQAECANAIHAESLGDTSCLCVVEQDRAAGLRYGEGDGLSFPAIDEDCERLYFARVRLQNFDPVQLANCGGAGQTNAINGNLIPHRLRNDDTAL